MKRTLIQNFILIPCTLCLLMLGAVNAKPKKIKIMTSYGDITIRLYDETPLHRDNMIKLVKQGFYDSLLFHRVINGFMIQGGDPASKRATAEKMLGDGDVGYTIPAEFNPALFHKKGVLAAARDNNPAKASSGCQFYIAQGKVYTDEQLNQMEQRSGIKYTETQRTAYKTLGGIPHLDQNYTVYGEVIKGLEVVDKIAGVKTATGDRPVENVRMKVKMTRK